MKTRAARKKLREAWKKQGKGEEEISSDEDRETSKPRKPHKFRCSDEDRETSKPRKPHKFRLKVSDNIHIYLQRFSNNKGSLLRNDNERNRPEGTHQVESHLLQSKKFHPQVKGSSEVVTQGNFQDPTPSIQQNPEKSHLLHSKDFQAQEKMREGSPEVVTSANDDSMYPNIQLSVNEIPRPPSAYQPQFETLNDNGCYSEYESMSRIGAAIAGSSITENNWTEDSIIPANTSGSAQESSATAFQDSVMQPYKESKEQFSNLHLEHKESQLLLSPEQSLPLQLLDTASNIKVRQSHLSGNGQQSPKPQLEIKNLSFQSQRYISSSKGPGHGIVTDANMKSTSENHHIPLSTSTLTSMSFSATVISHSSISTTINQPVQYQRSQLQCTCLPYKLYGSSSRPYPMRLTQATEGRSRVAIPTLQQLQGNYQEKSPCRPQPQNRRPLLKASQSACRNSVHKPTSQNGNDCEIIAVTKRNCIQLPKKLGSSHLSSVVKSGIAVSGSSTARTKSLFKETSLCAKKLASRGVTLTETTKVQDKRTSGVVRDKDGFLIPSVPIKQRIINVTTQSPDPPTVDLTKEKEPHGDLVIPLVNLRNQAQRKLMASLSDGKTLYGVSSPRFKFILENTSSGGNERSFMTKGEKVELGAGGEAFNGSGEEGYVGVGSVSLGGRSLVWAWRRGVGVCVLLVAASFSVFLVSSSKRAGLYTHVIFTFNHAPGSFVDIVVPSHNASFKPFPPPSAAMPKPSPTPSSKEENTRNGSLSYSSEKEEEEEEEEEGESQEGFLVHTPGCVIPDFDPFHHTITRFISNPVILTCKQPSAITTSKGTTLFYHQNVFRDNLEGFLTVYKHKITLAAAASAFSADLSSSSNSSSSEEAFSITYDQKDNNSSGGSSRLFAMTTNSTAVKPSRVEANSTNAKEIQTDPSAKSSVDHISSSNTSASSSGSFLPVDQNNVPELKCCYRAIYRVEQKADVYNAAADGRWRYSGWCTPLRGPRTRIKEDSILVYCNISAVIVYKNVHYFIQKNKVLKPLALRPLPSVHKHVPHKHNNQNSLKENNIRVPYQKTREKRGRVNVPVPRDTNDNLSVIIFGTDSASRLNMRRHLPKTYQYLVDTLGAVDLTGFNKVGDNTFPNLVPVTIGLSHQELANHTCVPKKEKFDDCPWIWKHFKKNGYATAFIEDSPWMGVYNYMHNGFVKQPTDYYGRAFFLASEKEIGNEKHGNSNVCQGDKLSVKVLQDYSLEVARTFLNSPSFSLYWSASLSHDYLNFLHHADIPHLEYLRQLRDMGALNNTALFFISDHGMRWGNIRSTYIGMLEERLPYVLVYLPPWFREKYSQAFSNVIINAHRLTANYDLYETLHDLAYGRYANISHVTSVPSPGAKGISLFKEIPKSRQCHDAGIPEHFCTCQDTHDVPLSDPVLGMAALYLKSSLNKDLYPHPQCVPFKEIEILTGRMSGSNKEMLPLDISTDVQSYLLQAKLLPGDVIIEATVRYNPQLQVFQLTGEMSRINKYGDTSHCLHHTILRKFCFCKDRLKGEELAEIQLEKYKENMRNEMATTPKT
ncbi:hypothetical protein SK128_003802 [Halocaridina rubra]|uniref:Uncharacterized protein n=1 Tax=Halocaridina rubra TaxID=373956 RepID=A0AAN8X253_HALRR